MAAHILLWSPIRAPDRARYAARWLAIQFHAKLFRMTASFVLHPWDVPTYTTSVAGRLVGLRRERVRRWLLGYEYDYTRAGEATRHRVKKAPVIHREGGDAAFASFLDLIDLLFVRKFLDAGVSLQKLRRALDEADSLI